MSPETGFASAKTITTSSSLSLLHACSSRCEHSTSLTVALLVSCCRDYPLEPQAQRKSCLLSVVLAVMRYPSSRKVTNTMYQYFGLVFPLLNEFFKFFYSTLSFHWYFNQMCVKRKVSVLTNVLY